MRVRARRRFSQCSTKQKIETLTSPCYPMKFTIPSDNIKKLERDLADWGGKGSELDREHSGIKADRKRPSGSKASDRFDAEGAYSDFTGFCCWSMIVLDTGSIVRKWSINDSKRHGFNTRSQWQNLTWTSRFSAKVMKPVQKTPNSRNDWVRKGLWIGFENVSETSLSTEQQWWVCDEADKSMRRLYMQLFVSSKLGLRVVNTGMGRRDTGIQSAFRTDLITAYAGTDSEEIDVENH